MSVDLNAPEVQEAIKNAVAEQLAGLETKNKELLNETKAEREKRRDLEKQLEQKVDGLSNEQREEYRRLKEAEAEAEKLEAEKKGEYEKVIQKLKDESDKALKTSTDEAEKYKSDLHKEMIENATLRALEKEKGNSALLSHIVKSRLKVEEGDSGRRVVAFDEDGEPMVAEGGATGTALDVVKHLKTKEEYMAAFEGVDIRGSGSKSTKPGNSGNNPWKKETFNLTEQGRIIQSDPALAATLKKEAGVS